MRRLMLNGGLIDELVSARQAGETILVSPERVQYMDVATGQYFRCGIADSVPWNTMTRTVR